MEDSSSSSDSSSMRKGGRVAYCIALLMRSLLTGTACSNHVPSSNLEGTVKVANLSRKQGGV